MINAYRLITKVSSRHQECLEEFNNATLLGGDLFFAVIVAAGESDVIDIGQHILSSFGNQINDGQRTGSPVSIEVKIEKGVVIQDELERTEDVCCLTAETP